MNRREFRKRTIEHNEKFIDIRRRECIVVENKLQFEITKSKSNDMRDIVEATLKLVKSEIKELLEGKEK